MWLLDTNVVSELRKLGTTRIDVGVAAWQADTPAAACWLSVVTVLELEQGVVAKERTDPAQGALLRRWLDGQVLSAFASRLLPVDLEVARCCARLNVPNRRSYRDALLAATALVHGLTVVTRNVVDFEATGVALNNPWSG